MSKWINVSPTFLNTAKIILKFEIRKKKLILAEYLELNF